LLSTIRLAQTPPAPISYHGAPDASADSEADSPPTRQWPPQHHKARPLFPIALPKERLDFRGPSKPVAPLQRKPTGRNGLPSVYTVSRLRPFARRRFSTFRPPCVFIRWRNPCVLARRRLFG
jgi:hypothetical protein